MGWLGKVGAWAERLVMDTQFINLNVKRAATLCRTSLLVSYDLYLYWKLSCPLAFLFIVHLPYLDCKSQEGSP